MGPEVTTPAEATPKLRVSRSSALKREVASLSHIAAEYLQCRAHWRARARVAEAELDRALDELLECEGLREDVVRIKAEIEAASSERKDVEDAYAERVAELEAELAKLRAPAVASPVAEMSVAESVPWAMTPDKLGEL